MTLDVPAGRAGPDRAPGTRTTWRGDLVMAAITGREPITGPLRAEFTTERRFRAAGSWDCLAGQLRTDHPLGCGPSAGIGGL